MCTSHTTFAGAATVTGAVPDLYSHPSVVVHAGPGCDETGWVPIDVILDCDPGHDDAVALAVAADRCRLLGVTTVAGNVALEDTTRNALAVVQLLGIDVEVHSGAATPLHSSSFEHAGHVHGEHGLAGATLPELQRTVASDDAAGFLVETTREQAGVWIVATGPLTNVAHALQQDPTLPGRIAGISIMGGGTFGNVTAAAEFNISFDPEAADIVLRCGAPIVLCGLDLTHQVLVDDTLVARSRALGNDFGRFCADFLDGYLANIRALTGNGGDAALHDPCAVLAITDPHLFDLVARHVVVETTGEHTRGMTVVDQRTWVRGGNVQWAKTIDAPTATGIILDAIAAAP